MSYYYWSVLLSMSYDEKPKDLINLIVIDEFE